MEGNRVILLIWFASLLAALATGRHLFYNLTYLLTSIIVLSYVFTWAGVNWISLTRMTRARRSQVGKTMEERFLVRNTGILPKLWLEVRDHSDLPGHRASRVVNSIRPRGMCSWTVRTICRKRGRFTMGPITISSGDPFGLFKMKREIPLTSSIVVYPATFDIKSFAQPIGQLPGGDAIRRRTHYITPNVAGVRDYMPGDSFSRIHWPSTARHQRLIVKEFELDPISDVWIFLDMERTVHVGLKWEPFFEWREPALLVRRPRMKLAPTTEEYSVTVSASLAKHFILLDRAVGLVAYAKSREVIQADRGERQLAKILETLAVIEAKGRVPFADVLSVEGVRLGRGITIVAITPSEDKRWVAITHELLRRGIRVVAVFISPSSFGEEGEGEDEIMAELVEAKTPAYVVRRGDALEVALSRPYH